MGAAGCGAPASKATVPKQPELVVADPGPLNAGDLALLDGAERLRIGDSPEDAERAFPVPANAFPFKDLPRMFAGQYRARGFETATMGFGAIYFENRLACAVHRQENVSAGEVQAIVRSYIAAFNEPDQMLPKGSIQYWFWSRDSERLMICSVPDREQVLRYDITIGLGVPTVMDALRMSYARAKEDQAIGEANRSAKATPPRRSESVK